MASSPSSPSSPSSLFTSSASSTLSRPNALLLWPAIAKLAGWRFRQMWRFLLVMWLSLLAMVVLVCAGPLFSRVATSAYVRSLVANAPDGPYITVDALSTHPTVEQSQQIALQTDQLLRRGTLGSYLHDAAVPIVQTPPLDLLSGSKTIPTAFKLEGYDTTQASQHSIIVQGRLPQATTNDVVELALSQDAASNLGVHVGSTFSGRYPVAVGSGVWKFRVVGIIAPERGHDPFWAMADPFSRSSVELASRYYFVDQGTPSYNVVASIDAIRPKIAALQTGFSGNDFTDVFVLFRRYPFDLTRLDGSDLPALSQQNTDLDTQIQNVLGRNSQDLAYVNIFGTTFTTLEFSTRYIAEVQITVTFLLVIILALVLFLVSLMSNVLIERQAAIIATLRSRGATRWHLFGAFVTQGVLLSVAALLIGPFLAILLVRVMAQFLLSPDNQSTVNVITNHPVQAALDVKVYALIAVGVALFVLILAVNRATKTDIVSFRRESARPQRVPLWRRFYLDLFIAILLLAGYGTYTYFWSFLTLSSSRINPNIYNLLTSLGFFVTPLVVVGILLLFLRLFPQLVRLVAYLAAKMRSAPATLAFAGMERTPRPAARIIVLLALAIASTCFLFTLIASKEQRNVDVATFSTEAADFSGTLPASDASKTVSQLQSYYSGLQGVQSATIGYQDVIQLDNQQGVASQGSITIDAVDTDTYARTAIWPTSYSSQPLSDLTAQLASHRADATAQGVVYALVDAATWQRLHLTQGEQFSLPASSSGNARIQYIALAKITYVPGVYDTPIYAWSGMGLIVDYQSYATVKAKATSVAASSVSPNYIWLRTQNDAASLKLLRNILPALNDRQQLISTIQNDPNHLSVIGALYIGVGAALALALIGTLILAWLSAVNRLTNFAVARALGMTPRQIAAVVLWEQGFVYMLALLVGIGLGALLTIFVPSAVAITDSQGDWATGLDVPSIQVIVPYPQLFLLLGVLAITCLIALLLMSRIVSRPSLSSTLRLNED